MIQIIRKVFLIIFNPREKKMREPERILKNTYPALYKTFAGPHIPKVMIYAGFIECTMIERIVLMDDEYKAMHIEECNFTGWILYGKN